MNSMSKITISTTKPDEIIKANSILSAAIDCIIYKAHPVIKFYTTREKNTLTQWELEEKFPDLMRDEIRGRLLKTNKDYVFFEAQVKQCLRGMEAFCKTYNIEFK